MAEKVTYSVSVLGRLWMPWVLAATDKQYERDSYPFTGYTEPVDWNDPETELEAIKDRIGLDFGDFSSIEDYEIVKTVSVSSAEEDWTVTKTKSEIIRPWSSEENELHFQDCMFPSEDDDE